MQDVGGNNKLFVMFKLSIIYCYTALNSTKIHPAVPMEGYKCVYTYVQLSHRLQWLPTVILLNSR